MYFTGIANKLSRICTLRLKESIIERNNDLFLSVSVNMGRHLDSYPKFSETWGTGTFDRVE
jgi:hypothetical protein